MPSFKKPSECVIPSKSHRECFRYGAELKKVSPIGHMRITPPNGGVVTGRFIPGDVGNLNVLSE